MSMFDSPSPGVQGAFAVDEITARVMDDVLAAVPSSAAVVYLLEADGTLRQSARRGGQGSTFSDLPHMVRGPLARTSVVFRPGDDSGFLLVPLRARNRYCGLVALLVTAEPRLTPAVRRMLDQIGARAGDLIEWASLTVAVERRMGQMQALYSAGLAMTSGLDIAIVLQQVADSARDLLNARYAALGISNEEGVIQEFYTSGINKTERERIGPLPEGKGLLGAIIHERRLIRLSNIADDSRSYGFPSNHPPMRSFIGVPIQLGDRVLGDLYLTEKRDGDFTEEDETLLKLLAAQAAVAIENARLYATAARLAVYEERERIGMDLHDSTIQSIYAVGLGLEDIEERLTTDDAAVLRADIERVIGHLNGIIRDIRGYIYNLRDAGNSKASERLEQLLNDFRNDPASDLRYNVNVASDAADQLTPARSEALIQVLKEALNNVRRHAGAKNVTVSVKVSRGNVVMQVKDDGQGFDPGLSSAGFGMSNMKDRSASAGGTLSVDSVPGSGTTVSLSLPVG